MGRLRYLYEQRVGLKEKSLDYGSGCDWVLKLDEGPHAGNVMRPSVTSCTNHDCPFESPEHALAPVSEALFQPASSIHHFALGFPPLDSLLRPMSEKHLVVFSGDQSSIVAELAVFRAQLPIESGGLDSPVLFIDGGNRSDPYLLSYFAKQGGIGPLSTMRRVASCRVFTLYQLAELVSEHLVGAAEDYGARLVVLADILGTFNEPELDEREARRILSAICEGVDELKDRSLVIATLPSPNKYDGLVMSWADAAISLSHSRDGIRAERLGRSSLAPAAVTFKPNLLLKAARTGGPR